MEGEDPVSGRVAMTPVQKVMVAVVLLLVAAFGVVLFRAPSQTERIWDWMYPNCGTSGSQWLGNGQCFMAVAPDSFTNVTTHYLKMLRLGSGTGSRFTYMSRGIFGGTRRMEQVGVVFSPSGEAVEAATMVSLREGQIKVIHVSHERGSSNTTVWLTFIDPRTGSVAPANSFTLVNSLLPPRAARGSGGNSMNLSITAFTARTNFAELDRYYSMGLGTPASRTNNTALPQVFRDPNLTLYRLPSAPRPVTNETGFIVAGRRSLSLVYFAACTNATAQGIVSGINY
jgi:hypothetical protein